MKYVLPFLCICIIVILFYNSQTSKGKEVEKIRIACIGDSITYAGNVAVPAFRYPAVLKAMLGEKYETKNFGRNGATLLCRADFPYYNCSKHKNALAFAPHIVFIMLGSNDAKEFNWCFKTDFVNDCVQMINSFKKLPTKPQVYLCYPPPTIYDNYAIENKNIIEIIPLARKAAMQTRCPIIDIYSELEKMPEAFQDGVHPNELGQMKIAELIYAAMRD